MEEACLSQGQTLNEDWALEAELLLLPLRKEAAML